MKIREINKDDEDVYEELNYQFGCVFFSHEWLSLFENVKIFGFFNGNDELIGGFPFFYQHRFGLKILRNPLFTPYIGPFLSISSKKPIHRLKKQKEYLSHFAEFVDNIKSPLKSFVLSPSIIDTQPLIWRDFKVVPFYTYLLSLEQDIDGMFDSMDSDKKNLIRKGIKEELNVQRADDYTVVFDLICKTFQRKAKKFNKYLVHKILFTFATDNNCFAFVCYNSGIPVSASFCIYDRNKAYYLFGGYDPKTKLNSAGVLTLWEAIKYSKSLNLKYFDFEGSMLPEIERFFRGFGGKLTPCYSVNKAYYLIEVILKMFKRERF